MSFGQGSFADDDSLGQESSLADDSFSGRSQDQDKDFMHFSFNNLASLLQRNLELAGEATAKAKISDSQRGTQMHSELPHEAAAKAPTAPDPPPHSAAVAAAPKAEAPPTTTPATMSDPSAFLRTAAAEADGGIPAIVPRTAALFVPSPPGQRRKTVYSLNGFDRQSGFNPKGQMPPQGEPSASGSPQCEGDQPPRD